jgi:mannose-6-phosphate isomerase-like protein (cupin superfamily)
MEIKKYDLESDSQVTVYKIWKGKKYFATIKIDGDYPSKGFVAKDYNREEFILVIEGSIIITLNNQKIILRSNDYLLIKHNDKYKISGKAEVIVFVKDGKSGETKLNKE